MSSMITLPSIMQIGAGAIQQLPDILKTLGCKKPLIICDATMVQLGFTDQIGKILSDNNIPVEIYSDVMPEPDDQSIYRAVEAAASLATDGLVALGGGSAIDSAKAIALLVSHGGKVRDYKVPCVIQQDSIPVIAIPTTAGTGSECTRVTVISDSENAEKMLCMGPGLMPKAAILDYQLTSSLPFRIAADTGIDALTHGIEAYVSRKANPFSDQQAIGALRLIGEHLLDACLDPQNQQAKEGMMLGASLAGIAFSNASVALVHGMSRPLGVHFHGPHGLSNAMLLRGVTEYSLPEAYGRYGECALHLGLVSHLDDLNQAHAALLAFLEQIEKTLEVPGMSAFGIGHQQYHDKIELMAQQALDSGSPANNPRVPSKDDIMDMYRRLYR